MSNTESKMKDYRTMPVFEAAALEVFKETVRIIKETDEKTAFNKLFSVYIGNSSQKSCIDILAQFNHLEGCITCMDEGYE